MNLWIVFVVVFFFFKQKTAYEIRKGDWSSDVCSSDLIVTSCWYSAELDNPINRKFAAEFRSEFKYDPGFYAAATYVEAAVLEATLKAIQGRVEDKEAFMKTVRGLKVDTVRGQVRFDQYGNVVGNVYIRKVERKDARLVNSVIHTYPDVSQFWTYDAKEFLKNPVYSRDFPPAKNLEP